MKKEYQISLDHLEIYLKTDKFFKNFNLLKEINETNTNLAYYDYVWEDWEVIEFKYSINTPANYSKGYTFSTLVNNKIIDAFNVALAKKEWVRSNHKLTIYASFIVAYWTEFIYKFLNDFFDTANFDRLKRFDIALDLPETKENFLNSLKIKPTSQLEWDEEKKEFETIYFGRRRNRTFMLRVYDKIKDTLKKWKSFLYDFWDATDVTRLEFEFWSQFCKKTNTTDETALTYETLLLDKQVLRDLFFSKINKISSYFFDEQFYKNYVMKNPEPSVKNLKDFYLNYNALPKNQITRIKTNKKYIDILWLYWFLSLCTDWFTDEDLAEIHQRFYDKIKGRIRSKYSKWETFDAKSLVIKKKFFEDVLDYVFDVKTIYSDEIYKQFSKTFDRFFKRNEKHLKNELVNWVKALFEDYKSKKMQNIGQELIFDLETTFDMFKNKHNL